VWRRREERRNEGGKEWLPYLLESLTTQRNFWGDDAPGTLRHLSHRVLGLPFSRDASGQQPYESVWLVNEQWVGKILSCPSCPADHQTAGLPRSNPDPRIFEYCTITTNRSQGMTYMIWHQLFTGIDVQISKWPMTREKNCSHTRVNPKFSFLFSSQRVRLTVFGGVNRYSLGSSIESNRANIAKRGDFFFFHF